MPDAILLRQIDPEIRPLVAALCAAGLETDWSCAGSGPGHMTIRPTIQIRTRPWYTDQDMRRDRQRIETIMAHFGIAHYWLALVFSHGGVDTHGGEPVWLLQVPGRFDFLALPVAYAVEYIDGDDDLLPGYQPLALEGVDPQEVAVDQAIKRSIAAHRSLQGEQTDA